MHELRGSFCEVFVDLNDDHNFQTCKILELLTESKTVIYFSDYLLQVPDRKHLINLLDLVVLERIHPIGSDYDIISNEKNEANTVLLEKRYKQ